MPPVLSLEAATTVPRDGATGVPTNARLLLIGPTLPMTATLTDAAGVVVDVDVLDGHPVVVDLPALAAATAYVVDVTDGETSLRVTFTTAGATSDAGVADGGGA